MHGGHHKLMHGQVLLVKPIAQLDLDAETFNRLQSNSSSTSSSSTSLNLNQPSSPIQKIQRGNIARGCYVKCRPAFNVELTAAPLLSVVGTTQRVTILMDMEMARAVALHFRRASVESTI